WLALLGDKAYDAAIAANTLFNKVRRLLGLTYWSLSKWAKLKVKNAVNFISEFERTLAAEAHARRRRHHLRPYPSCDDSRDIRRSLRQLRRLGGKLHRGGRASGRKARDHHLDGREARRRHGPARQEGARSMIRVLVATDAWHPQVNGVVQTLSEIA